MPMTPKQLRQVLIKLGLTQISGARALGVAPRTMRQWIAGDRRIAEPVARLLSIWVEHPDLLTRPGKQAKRHPHTTRR